MKRIIALILLTLLLSGCSMNYKLSFDKNLLMEEEITVSETKNAISKFNLSPDDFVDDTISSYSTDPKYSNYIFKKDVNRNYYSGIVKASYLDFEQFKSKNTLTNYFFSDVAINKNGDIVTLDFISNPTNELLNESTDAQAALSTVTITILLPFKVTENNADAVNKNNNSYTWNYSNSVQDKSIHLVFDTSKISLNVNMPSWVFVLIGFIVIGVIIGGYVYYKYRKNSVL